MFNKTFFLLAVLLLPLIGMSQFTIKGKIVDESTGDLLPMAHIELGKMKSVSNDNGSFIIEKVKKGNYIISVQYIGYEAYNKEIQVDKSINLTIKLQSKTYMEDAVIISAQRAHENTGTSFTNITKADIKKADNGVDLPYILDMTPSLVTTSDAGAGIGYTGMRIRGSDATRINITINGIPLNDGESQGAYFVDLPDFASSTNSIQIQRGVGTSVNGPSAFGASIDLQTNGLNQNPFAEVSTTFGSFNTQRYRFATSTGLVNGKYSFDARLSSIHSDGYIDRATTDMKSYFVSGAYYGKKSVLRLNVFSGKEITYQAWGGVPKDSLATNRTFNPYTYENEVDNYQQTHFQLFYTRKINSSWNLSSALHYTRGLGYYESMKSGKKLSSYGLSPMIIGNDTITRMDLIQRKWLDNDFYGGQLNLNRYGKKLNLNLGVSATQYLGGHYGQIIWSEYASNLEKDYQWYRNDGNKIEANIFAKASYAVNSKFNIYADVQNRFVDYSMTGIHDDLHDLTAHHSFNFINPKLGLVYKIKNLHEIYASLAVANKEPSRSNYKDADADYEPKPENLTDIEMGYAYNDVNKLFRVNFYYMLYKDQLVLTGKVNGVGEAIMQNVDQSYRMGLEVVAAWKFNDLLEWNFNAGLSENKIINYVGYIDNWDTWGQEVEKIASTDISYSPSVVLKNTIAFHANKNLDVRFLTRYVGRQYMDNTSNLDRSLDPYLVNDLRFDYRLKVKGLKGLAVNFAINNIFNEMYESNAWVYRYLYGGQEHQMEGYYPQAGINFLGGLTLTF